MKTIFTFLLSVFFMVSVYAQQETFVPVDGKKTENISQTQSLSLVKNISDYRTMKNSSKALKSRYYNFGDAITNKFGFTPDFNLNYMFPDTTILGNFGGSLSPVWIHSIGELVNPLSPYFYDANELNINQYMPYTIDTIVYYCLYTRNTSASVVDTLLVQIGLNPTTYSYYNSTQSPGVYNNYGVDTLRFLTIKKDAMSHITTDASYINIKYPLTEAVSYDTLSDGTCVISVPINISAPAGSSFSATFAFIPGYTHIPFDTLSKYNTFTFFSNEEQGENTFPIYEDKDWNMSYLCTKQIKYTSTMTKLYPSYAWQITTSSFSYEHHIIDYLLTADVDGIDQSVNNSLSVSQNQPNPFSGNTTINYSLNQRADVNLVIYNVAGAKVMEINEGTKNIGNHSMNVNASNLKAGVYFYTLNAGDNKVTRKMIVF
jgi:hypothetical protein